MAALWNSGKRPGGGGGGTDVWYGGEKLAAGAGCVDGGVTAFWAGAVALGAGCGDRWAGSGSLVLADDA